MSHVPVEIDSCLPDQIRGVFFSNEFLDALPVEAVLCSSAASSAAGSWHSRRGASSGTVGDLASPEAAAHLRRFCPPPSVGNCYEANLEALTWIGRISSRAR